ncbi:thioredoxin family protein [Weissella ceti]|uniref:thioredoxin family protein n=1 Tax=Weissella ceti TaxID=759620 RepID=UPI001BCF7B02|nr:thioredoxin family protein [Weissella ceti]QVK12616.1 thioredoxin family protein [Weissella ceti]
MAKTKSNGNIFSDLTWKGWLGFVAILLVLIGFGFGQYNKVLSDTKPVSAQQVTNAVDNNEQVVFYHSDCSACQKAMPLLMGRNLIKKDTLFINIKGKENRQLLKKFDIKSVPTLINVNGTFSNAPATSLMENMIIEHDDNFYQSTSTTAL